MSKGRKVPPPVQPGERRQHKPGELSKSLHKQVRANIQMLADAGFKRDGRGLLMVEKNDAIDTGIESAQYYGIMRLAEMQKRVPFGDMQPLSEAVKKYNPETEFVALVLDITRTLPGPQLWWEIFEKGK